MAERYSDIGFVQQILGLNLVPRKNGTPLGNDTSLRDFSGKLMRASASRGSTVGGFTTRPAHFYSKLRVLTFLMFQKEANVRVSCAFSWLVADVTLYCWSFSLRSVTSGTLVSSVTSGFFRGVDRVFVVVGTLDKGCWRRSH